MSNYKLPSMDELQDMLSMFIPNGAETKEIESADDSSLKFAAVYEDSEAVVVCRCACDLPLAAAFGASLSMLPAGAVEDMVKEGALTEACVPNLYEVMNMFSSLFMDDRTSHLKLTKVVPFQNAPACENNKQNAFEVSAGNYGKGSIIFSRI